MQSANERLRSELIAALAERRGELCRALGRESARPIALAPHRHLQFEVDDLFFGVTLTATEETILPGEWLDAALPAGWFQRAEDAGIDFNAIIAEELCPWFADCWREAGGPTVFRPAYLFFHLHPERQYDLEGRRWVSFEK